MRLSRKRKAASEEEGNGPQTIIISHTHGAMTTLIASSFFRSLSE